MKQSYYLFKNGVLRRKDNTLRLESESGEARDIPIERVEDIYCFGEISLNNKLLVFLSQNGVCLHVFNYYENYCGTYYPRESLLSGAVHIRQAEHYLDPQKRLFLARRFVEAGAFNMMRNLRYYDERGRDCKAALSEMKSLTRGIEHTQSVEELMGVEGNIRRQYYSKWNDIFAGNAEFSQRVMRPPDNMINSLLSFSNMLVYTTVVSEIYNTQLDPTVSFLHEPGTRRFSLSLDIAEVFKPLLSDRMVFSLINKHQISAASFEDGERGLLLKEGARRDIVSEFDARLKQTIQHRTIGRSVYYRRLIRLEAYKLIKHFNAEQEYDGFKIWW